ncbi:MAG: 2-phosphosulfolactate phosphatase [Aquihabitans sp.]
MVVRAESSSVARYVSTPGVVGVGGPVVVVDVIRAFSTAAYAFGAGARCIYLVASVEEALAFKAAHAGSIAMGEDRGLRPDGFDLPNSPALAAAFDMNGRIVVQRTSAGTQGVVAASSASRLWCASLRCASATAAAVRAAGLGAPTYVITGWFADRPDRPGSDDRLTAEHIESIRLADAVDHAEVARRVADSDEATRTLALGPAHCHPDDIALAVDVDRFAFAMEVTSDEFGLRLDRVDPA